MSVKREVVAEMTAYGVSERAACRVMGLSRSSQRYQPRAKRGAVLVGGGGRGVGTVLGKMHRVRVEPERRDC